MYHVKVNIIGMEIFDFSPVLEAGSWKCSNTYYIFIFTYFTDHHSDKSNEMIAYRGVDALHESDNQR